MGIEMPMKLFKCEAGKQNKEETKRDEAGRRPDTYPQTQEASSRSTKSESSPESQAPIAYHALACAA
jgi:hypothetical protein